MRAHGVSRPPRSPPALRAARVLLYAGQPAGGTARRRVGAGTPGFSGRADSRMLAAWGGPSRAGKGTVSRAVAGWASAPVAHAHPSTAIRMERIEPDWRACVPSRRARMSRQHAITATDCRRCRGAYHLLANLNVRFRLKLQPKAGSCWSTLHQNLGHFSQTTGAT